MKIQKGIVKYKDRNDIVCAYGVTDDGRQYFFLDENGQKKFSNGNRIASTELVEAVDPMVKASHIGIIDSNGNEIIPFINKSIRPVNDSIILVELATPISQSVVDAINLKSDPLSATKLVSTPAVIKENLNARMGNDGRYIFNDQFSEATICDIDGNNLINNEYFSFVGLTADKLYFSKNIPESEITEYSIMPPEVQTNETQAINITEAQVPVEAVEGAFSQEETVQASNVFTGADSVIPVVSEATANENVYNTDVAPLSDANATDIVVPSDTVSSSDAVSTEDNMSYGASSMFTHPSEVANNPVQEVVTAESTVDTATDNSLSIPVVDEDKLVEPTEEITPKSSIIVIPPVVDNMVSVGDNVIASSVFDTSSISPVEASVPSEGEVADYTVASDVAEDSEITIPVVDDSDLNEASSSEEEINIPQVDPEVEEELNINIYGDSNQENVTQTDNSPFSENSSDKDGIDGDVTDDKSSEVIVPENEQESMSDDSLEVSLPEVDAQEESELPPMVEEETIEKTSSDSDTIVGDVSSEIFDDIHEVSEVIPDEISTIDEDLIDSDEFSDTTTLDTMVSEISTDEVIDDIEDDILDLDEDLFSTKKYDSIKKVSESEEYMDSFDNDLYGKSSSTINDSIMVDVAKSLSSLMKQNRNQKSTISQYQEKLNKLSASRRNAIEKSKAQEQKIEMQDQKLGIQEQKIEVLSSKNKSCEATINNLESKLKALESRLREQDKLIATQSQELEVLRPQKDDLAKLVADAQALLGDDDSSDSYDYEDSRYRRAA